MTTNELSDWKASLDDLLLHRWEFSSSEDRRNAIELVERRMGGEIIEMVKTEPAPIRKAEDEIGKALKMDKDAAIVHLMAIIARTMVEQRVLDPKKKNTIYFGA